MRGDLVTFLSRTSTISSAIASGGIGLVSASAKFLSVGTCATLIR